MDFKERIYSVLVVSCSEKFNIAFTELLPPSGYQPTHIAASASEAKRCLAERFFGITGYLPYQSPHPVLHYSML